MMETIDISTNEPLIIVNAYISKPMCCGLHVYVDGELDSYSNRSCYRPAKNVKIYGDVTSIVVDICDFHLKFLLKERSNWGVS